MIVLNRLPLFTIMTGVSLAIGLLVPTIFEFSENPAARSRHGEMEFAALLSVLIALIIVVILWFWNWSRPGTTSRQEADSEPANRIQFRIIHVLIVTTLIAATLVAAPLFDVPTPILLWIMGLVLVATLIWTGLQVESVRSRMGAIMAGLFLPFAWIVPYSEPFGHASGLLSAIVFGPGLLPAVFLSRGSNDISISMAVLFVMLEIGVGIWLARRGGKLAWIYILLILCWSTVTSLGFHALYRM